MKKYYNKQLSPDLSFYFNFLRGINFLMVTYFEHGVAKPQKRTTAQIDFIDTLILRHPQQEKINHLRSLPYGSLVYRNYKKKGDFLAIKPHGIFKNVKQPNGKRIEILQSLSGYLYFDIDANDINSPLDVYKQYLLQTYPEYISRLGISIGGQGIFFLVKVKGLTEQNFTSVHQYFRTEIFKEIPTDKNATGISRSFFIPSDKKLYVNNTTEIDIIGWNNPIIENKIDNEKCMGECIYSISPDVYDSNIHFLHITDVLNTLKFQTFEVPKGETMIEKDIDDYIKLWVQDIIPDGKKHKKFCTYTNILVYLNPAADLQPILSYINYVNQSRTDGKPMITKEMVRTVTWAYNLSKQTGIWNQDWLRTKGLHWGKNPGKTKDERKRISDERRIKSVSINNRRKQRKSIMAIEMVVAHLKEQGIKPTISKVAEILKGRRSIWTIKKYWRVVMPKKSVLQDKQEEQTGISLLTFVKGKDEAPKVIQYIDFDEYRKIKWRQRQPCSRLDWYNEYCRTK